MYGVGFLFLCVAQTTLAAQQLDLNSLFGGGGGGKGGKEACPKGQVYAPKLKEPKLVCNGCGPQGMQVQEPYGLYKCCNMHDLCYTLCGNTFKSCEKDFTSCMKKVCKEQEKSEQGKCNEQAKGFQGMTKLFGGGIHAGSMASACDCMPKEEASQRWTDYVTGIYNKYDDSKATEENVAKVMEEWKGKEGKLTLALTKKYRKAEITWDNIKDEL